MRTKWESWQAWQSESIVTQPSVKPYADVSCWRHKRHLKTVMLKPCPAGHMWPAKQFSLERKL